MSGSDEELAGRFVHGRSVDWAGVARTLLSSLVFVVSAGVILFWEAVASLPRRFIGGVLDFWATLLSRPFEHGAEQFWLAWEVAASEFPIAGPLDYAIATMLVAVVFWLAGRLGYRLVRGVFG